MIAKKENYQGYWNREIMLYKGEEVIDRGTIREIAERRGCQKATLYFYLMPSYERRLGRRKNQDNALRAVAV